MSDQERRILKSSLHRSVRLEVAPDGARTVVKRFASRTLAASTLDRARAAREHRLLGELSARGIPAPRPLGLERVDGGWEVRMEWIETAEPLARYLSGECAWPAAPGRLARPLAGLLATLHHAGVDHPDLHPGNVLIDARGRIWAIDFHKARRAERLKPASAWRDLVSLASGVRESTSPGFRARFFLEWMRRAPSELVGALLARAEGSRSALARRLEDGACRRRFAAVRKRRARWLRASSSCAPVDAPFNGFVRAELAEDAARLDAAAGAVDPSTLTLEGLSAREARAIWCSAARLEEHGLPALRPLAASLAPRPWVRLAASSPGRACRAPGDVRDARALHSLGKLCAQLADRRLRVRCGAFPALWRRADGRLELAVALELEQDPRAGDGIDLVRVLALAGLDLEQLTRRERAAYAAGILAGASLSAPARARLRATLRHG